MRLVATITCEFDSPDDAKTVQDAYYAGDVTAEDLLMWSEKTTVRVEQTQEPGKVG